MMGVGKSTIGKKLSKKLVLKFIDVDKAIENQEKISIKQIFERKGEIYFRKIEKNITLEILKNNNLIVALGGGAFINPQIRKKVLASSISIWLDLSENLLLTRLGNIQKRPLLNKEKLKVTIKQIYSERKKFYNKSNFRIKCDLLDINEVVKAIINIYEDARN